jgi:hypothetical protein
VRWVPGSRARRACTASGSAASSASDSSRPSTSKETTSGCVGWRYDDPTSARTSDGVGVNSDAPLETWLSTSGIWSTSAAIASASRSVASRLSVSEDTRATALLASLRTAESAEERRAASVSCLALLRTAPRVKPKVT